MTHGAIAHLFRADDTGTARMLLGFHDAAGSFLGGLSLDSSNRLVLTSGAATSIGPTVTPLEWTLAVVLKPTGTATPRFTTLEVDTASWGHADGDTALANWTAPGELGTIRFSREGTSEHYDGRVCAAGGWLEVPWAADGDIETAQLESEMEGWSDAAPDAWWLFNQISNQTMVEDLSPGLADEIGTTSAAPLIDSSLDFQDFESGIFLLTTYFMRNIQNEAGSTGIVWDLNPTQGTLASLTSASISSTTFTEVFRFHFNLPADTVVLDPTFSTSINISAVSASTLRYRWRVQRYNSAGTLLNSSIFSSEQNTTGVKTQDFEFDEPWVPGDRVAVSVELKKQSGGGGRTITALVNTTNSWLEADVGPVPPEEHSGDGTAESLTLTTGQGTGTPAIGGTGDGAGATLTPAAGAGTPAIAGSGQPASMTLTAGPGTGGVGGEEHSGSGEPAGLTLAAAAGAGTPAAAGGGTGTSLSMVAAAGQGSPAAVGTGQAESVTLTPAAGTGTPSITGNGTLAGLTLTAGLGGGEVGGGGAEEHSGSGAPAGLALAAGQGAGVPATGGTGATCTLQLAAAPGTGTPAVAGTGDGAVLLLAAWPGSDQLDTAGPTPAERTYRIPAEDRTYRIPPEDRTYRIVR
jgi:hypothetical protein